jgi:hypothetical protein
MGHQSSIINIYKSLTYSALQVIIAHQFINHQTGHPYGRAHPASEMTTTGPIFGPVSRRFEFAPLARPHFAWEYTHSKVATLTKQSTVSRRFFIRNSVHLTAGN